MSFEGSHVSGLFMFYEWFVTQTRGRAFRANHKVTVIGSTTAGADGNVSPFYLVGGIHTMISGIGVFYPDGRGTQRVGFVPDEVVKPIIEGIKNGKDEVLERAIEIIIKVNSDLNSSRVSCNKPLI